MNDELMPEKWYWRYVGEVISALIFFVGFWPTVIYLDNEYIAGIVGIAVLTLSNIFYWKILRDTALSEVYPFLQPWV